MSLTDMQTFVCVPVCVRQGDHKMIVRLSQILSA